jgi:hypothetical protein
MSVESPRSTVYVGDRPLVSLRADVVEQSDHP